MDSYTALALQRAEQMQINIDLHETVLRVAFEDTTLMQCTFYYVLARDAIHERSLGVHTYTK